MGRIVVAFVLTLSLALGGVANAMAAMDCPYLKAAKAHDCCPPNGQHEDQGPTKSKASECSVGQLCRSIPAVTPLSPSLRQTIVLKTASSPSWRDEVVGHSQNSAVWKPPRAA